MKSQIDWKALRKYSVHASFFLGFIYLVGLIGFFLPVTKPVFIKIVPVTLLLSAAFLLLFHRPFQKKQLWLILSVMIGGFLLELIGVKTGLLFGNYHYGSALGWKIAGTPVIIGLNWAMLTYMTYSIFIPVRMHWTLKTLAASALMLLYDVAMEPVAMSLDFWHWKGEIIPSQNYFTWFIVALVFHAFFHGFRMRFVNKIAANLFYIQLVFFLLLNLIV